MARIPAATRDSIPEDQRATYDEFLQARGSAPRGPLSIMINAPEVAKRGGELSEYLRRGSTLSSKIQELAMLTTARELDCQFIWNAHAASGRAAGLRDEVVDKMRDKVELTGLAPDEAAVVNYGREFFRTNRVTQATFDAALAQFGTRGLTELSSLMGYYALLAFNVNAFEVELPPDRTEKELPV